jgi:hypothetical protein
MGTYKHDIGYLAWLMAGLNTRRLHIDALLRRLTGFVASGIMHPLRLHKITAMLLQIAADRDKETAIIGQIEAIEAKHRFRKKYKTLHIVSPEPAAAIGEKAVADDPLPSRHGWTWILGLLALMPRHKIK